MPLTIPAGWATTGDALSRTIQCADFVEALALTVEIGKLAEANDHHPDIDIRYRTVHLSLSTHDAGHQITDKDYSLARKINDLTPDALRAASEDLRQRFAA